MLALLGFRYKFKWIKREKKEEMACKKLYFSDPCQTLQFHHHSYKMLPVGPGFAIKVSYNDSKR